MNGSDALPELMTTDQLAERLGVTRRHVRRLVDERRVPFVRVGRFIRFDPAEISAWLGLGIRARDRPPGPQAPPTLLACHRRRAGPSSSPGRRPPDARAGHGGTADGPVVT